MPRHFVLILKSLLAVSVILLLSACLLPVRTITVRGVLHGDLVWQGVVHVQGDVILAEDASLKILPGTRVLFLPPGDDELFVEHPYFPGSELIVKGRITAIGKPSAPITFASIDPDAGAGSWGAVNIEGSPEAIFEYCVFRQADSAVHSRDARVYIEESIFEDNLVGIRFHSTEFLIEHNLLRNNHTAVRFHFGSPVICENRFEGNRVNLFITSHPRDYRIENNAFGVAADYQVVFGEEVPDDVLLSGNYWETADDETLPATFFDGQRADYLGRVLVSPVRSSPASRTGPSWSR